MIKIYQAGPLFTLAERSFNRALRDALVARRYSVFLPQESEDNINHRGDHEKIALSDLAAVQNCDVLLANLDGAQVDDGTALEVGMARALGKITIGYRTDFRVCGDDPELHVNLMFRLMDHVIQFSSLENDWESSLEYFEEKCFTDLAYLIDKQIKSKMKKAPRGA